MIFHGWMTLQLRGISGSTSHHSFRAAHIFVLRILFGRFEFCEEGLGEAGVADGEHRAAVDAQGPAEGILVLIHCARFSALSEASAATRISFAVCFRTAWRTPSSPALSFPARRMRPSVFRRSACIAALNLALEPQEDFFRHLGAEGAAERA